MRKYSHIKAHEKSLDLHEKKVGELKKILDVLEKNLSGYQELVDYYYSDSWRKDFDDDEQGLIPDDLKRGVLSEDGIYNLMSEVNKVSIRMLELGVKYLKSF